jgi:hypothetical protein
MNRMLLIACVIAVLVVGADSYIRNHIHSRRVMAGELRTPSSGNGLSPEDVHVFRIDTPGGAQPWTYRKISGHWRYPQSHNAYVLTDRADRFISQIVESKGTVILASPSQRNHYGLEPASTITVHLYDSLYTPQIAVDLGRAIPGRNVNESYIRPVAADTIFHIHANPLAILGDLKVGNPPILDPQVFPEALSESQIVRIDFDGSLKGISSMYRVEADTAKGEKPVGLPEGPMYLWKAVYSDRTEDCNLISANAYLRYLRDLEHNGNLDEGIPAAEGASTIILLYESAQPDTLDVFALYGTEETIVRNRRAGQVFSLSSARANLVFPSVKAVVDSLPTPSPYLSGIPSRSIF